VRAFRTLVLLLVLAPEAAWAQLPPEIMDLPTPALMREAFATEYGRLISAEFAAVLARSADPACATRKDLDLRGLEAPARDILERRGARMFDLLRRAHDGGRFEATLAAIAGSGAKAEFVRLRDEPAVRRLLELHKPARHAEIVDRVAENVDRYVLLNRVPLQGRIAPISTGNDRLLRANPGEQAAQAVDAYLRDRPSPQVTRWLALEEAVQQATAHARETEALLRMGPSQLMVGLDEDLAALCVPPRR
jgi:hypothetical protein